MGAETTAVVTVGTIIVTIRAVIIGVGAGTVGAVMATGMTGMRSACYT
jgi:hypothetical protein